MKHTDIRAAVLDALELHEHGATLFDGRPVVFDEEDFPAVAVYLTDAEYTGEALDAIPGGPHCILKFSCLLRCRIQSWIRGWSPGFIRR